MVVLIFLIYTNGYLIGCIEAEQTGEISWPARIVIVLAFGSILKLIVLSKNCTAQNSFILRLYLVNMRKTDQKVIFA